MLIYLPNIVPQVHCYDAHRQEVRVRVYVLPGLAGGSNKYINNVMYCVIIYYTEPNPLLT